MCDEWLHRSLLTLHPSIHFYTSWSQIRQDYPLNLSISVSGGKETNKDSPSNGEWSGKSSNLKSGAFMRPNCSLKRCISAVMLVHKSPGIGHHRGWESRLGTGSCCIWGALDESSCLGMQLKVGGKFHLRLNTGKRPIANKYREGKMKSTLKRELNSAWNC